MSAGALRGKSPRRVALKTAELSLDDQASLSHRGVVSLLSFNELSQEADRLQMKRQVHKDNQQRSGVAISKKDHHAKFGRQVMLINPALKVFGGEEGGILPSKFGTKARVGIELPKLQNFKFSEHGALASPRKNRFGAFARQVNTVQKNARG